MPRAWKHFEERSREEAVASAKERLARCRILRENGHISPYFRSFGEVQAERLRRMRARPWTPPVIPNPPPVFNNFYFSAFVQAGLDLLLYGTTASAPESVTAAESAKNDHHDRDGSQ
jgi:hypothetical protein